MSDKYLKYEDGSILRYVDGSPVPYRHFINDPSDDDEDDGYVERSSRKMIEELLAREVEPPEDKLLENGFREVDGK